MSAKVNLRQSDECQPLAPIPAWWSGFIFHVLNPRQASMYVYLTMLCTDAETCSPTVEQIREDLGLYSTSMVFEALAVLEDLHFITRERQSVPGSRGKRNLYRRPTCEATILRLLERDRLDASLHPNGRRGAPAASEARGLIAEGLRLLLDDSFDEYLRAAPEEKRDVLMGILRSRTS